LHIYLGAKVIFVDLYTKKHTSRYTQENARVQKKMAIYRHI